MNSELTSLLKKDQTKNVAILGFFSNYRLEDHFTEGNSMLLLGRSDHLWAHISSDSRKELTELLNSYYKKTNYYFSVEDWMIPVIKRYGSIDWMMTTSRYMFDKKINIDTPKSDISRIDKSYATFLYEQSDYKAYISKAYIEDRLSKDISAGIFKDNKLVAWGFTHDDGALGFLHVLEAYRKRGYGLDILSGLINMRRQEQKPVFGNIVSDIKASARLVTKIGFTFDRKTSWVKLK